MTFSLNITSIFIAPPLLVNYTLDEWKIVLKWKWLRISKSKIQHTVDYEFGWKNQVSDEIRIVVTISGDEMAKVERFR